MSENLLWDSSLDGRYTLTVVRTGAYRAELSIHDGGQILHRESVGLAYEALFGPDVDDRYPQRIGPTKNAATDRRNVLIPAHPEQLRTTSCARIRGIIN